MKEIIIPNEVISNKIYFIRNQKVMLDRDLAALYEVETKRINEQIKRNSARFPENFMFQLNEAELEILISQFVTSKTILKKDITTSKASFRLKTFSF